MEQVTYPGCGDIYLWELGQGCVVGRASVMTPSPSQQDLSQWNKVKVLLNRILWRSLRHPEPPALPDGPVPR